MTEGEKTMRRLIAEAPDPRTSVQWWLWLITFFNLWSLYMVRKLPLMIYASICEPGLIPYI